MAKAKTKARRNKGPWQEPNRGTAFKTSGKGPLFLEFQSHHIEALRPTTAQAWSRSSGVESRFRGESRPRARLGELIRHIRAERAIDRGRPRHAYDMEDRPPMRPFEIRRRENMRKFFSYVNEGIVEELAQRYPYNDWQLFRLLKAEPRALDYCQGGHRVAMYLLAYCDDYLMPVPRSKGSFWKRWLKRPLLDLVERFSFPRRRSTLRALKKLGPMSVNIQSIAALRRVLSFPEGAKRLHHAPLINRNLIYCCLPGTLERVSPNFLRELVGARSRYPIATIVGDVHRLERQDGVRHRPQFSSIDVLMEYHDRLVRQARQHRQIDVGPFVEPPEQLLYPGMKATWLDTSTALRQEGVKMHHCLGSIGSHHRLAAKGGFFAWSIEVENIRATLAFRRTDHGFTVYDFVKACNERVPHSLRQWAEQTARAWGRRNPLAPHDAEIVAEEAFYADHLPF